MAKSAIRPHSVAFPRSGVYAFESIHSPEYSALAFDVHDFHELVLIRKGSGRLYLAGQTIKVSAGTVIHLTPGSEHKFEDKKDDPLTLLGVCFYTSFFLNNPFALQSLKLFRTRFLQSPRIAINDNYHLNSAAALHKSMIFEQTRAKQGSEPIILCRLTELLVLYSRIALEYHGLKKLNNKEQALLSTLTFLEHRFMEPVSILALAEMAGMSYRGYTGAFKAHTGKTVTGYLTRLRIDFAKKRLLETRHIAHSAMDAGFNDLANFYRTFRKLTGMSPARYVKTAR